MFLKGQQPNLITFYITSLADLESVLSPVDMEFIYDMMKITFKKVHFYCNNQLIKLNYIKYL